MKHSWDVWCESCPDCAQRGLLCILGENYTYVLACSRAVCRHLLTCKEPVWCWQVDSPKGTPCLGAHCQGTVRCCSLHGTECVELSIIS